MLSNLLNNVSLFHHLYIIDKQIADEYRRMPCPFCGGPLYYANYLRKPRGEPPGVAEECFIRFSLCCGKEGCRQRVMPPSCRFLDRKVYWHGAILAVMADWQNKVWATSIFGLSKLFDISRNTLKRWIIYYQEIFPSSRQWQNVRGRVSASIKNNHLPAGLINDFTTFRSSKKAALVACLKFLSGWSCFSRMTRAG